MKRIRVRLRRAMAALAGVESVPWFSVHDSSQAPTFDGATGVVSRIGITLAHSRLAIVFWKSRDHLHASPLLQSMPSQADGSVFDVKTKATPWWKPTSLSDFITKAAAVYGAWIALWSALSSLFATPDVSFQRKERAAIDAAVDAPFQAVVSGLNLGSIDAELSVSPSSGPGLRSLQAMPDRSILGAGKSGEVVVLGTVVAPGRHVLTLHGTAKSGSLRSRQSLPDISIEVVGWAPLVATLGEPVLQPPGHVCELPIEIAFGQQSPGLSCEVILSPPAPGFMVRAISGGSEVKQPEAPTTLKAGWVLGKNQAFTRLRLALLIASKDTNGMTGAQCAALRRTAESVHCKSMGGP